MIEINNYKNIFLDRDGVINEVVIRDETISSPWYLDEFKFRQDFLDFYEKLHGERSFYVVTNQPDIKRKFLKTEDLHEMHKLILEYSYIKEIMYCPHDDEDICSCRKPQPGMLNQIIKKFNLCRNECLMIGDSTKDIIAAKSAGIDSVLLKTEYNEVIPEVYCSDTLMNLI